MGMGQRAVRAVAVAAFAVCTGVLGLRDMHQAAAQAVPPFRVFGSVAIDGAPAPPGTRIEAVVNGASCGSDRLIGSSFVIDVLTAATHDWCATPGATVSFRIGGVPAQETAVYEVGFFLRLNLSRAPVPVLDPKLERPRMEVVPQDEPVKLKVFTGDEKADVTVVSRFAAGSVLAAIYPVTPAGTATIYVVAPSGSLIVSAPDPQERCSTVYGHTNMLVCTVVAGSVIAVESLG